MNRYMRYWTLLLAIAVGFSSCRKYEEGPNISLRTKRARVTNNWKLESALVNGVERSLDPFYAKQKHYMYSDGKYLVTIINPVTLEARNLQGTWKLFDDDKRIALTTRDEITLKDSTNEYNILKLFNKQFWIRKTDNSEEYHMVPFE